MASIKVTNEENIVNGSDDEDATKQGLSSDDIPLKAEEYLKSDDVQFCTDPKLRREKQKLEDLLQSYKKLINKLDSKFQTEEEKKAEEERLRKVPEIYAVLHPEIYKNPREDEKNRLIQKFSKRHFTSSDRAVPPICLTPPFRVHDKRQEEKDRLVKILSSCPARFLNTPDVPATPVKLRRPKYISLSPSFIPNEREVEKERLSKILATSGIYYRKHLDQKSNPLAQRRSLRNKPSPNATSHLYSPVKSNTNMVRVGEYSPLSSKEREPTLRGLCDSSTTTTYLPTPRKVLGSVAEEKIDRAISTNDHESIIEDLDEGDYQNNNGISIKKRCNSISTQTDPSDIAEENIEEIQQIDHSPTRNPIETNQLNYSPRRPEAHQPIYYLSPREKLMSDLHGVSQCFPGISSRISPRGDQDVKLRQAAYAKALQEQIEEKRKMEEERRKKEKEEEDIIDHRIRLQQEKLEHEISDEQKKKQDWLAQRQSHEEVLRRKMLEMQLEAQELKKTERRKRRDSDNLSELRRETTHVRPPQTTTSEPSQRLRPNAPQRFSQRRMPTKIMPTTNKDNKPRAEEREGRFDSIRLAPLLDADTQNILSSYPSSDFAFPSAQHPRLYRNGETYGDRQKLSDKERAEDLLRKPLDFRIGRPSSPPIPAVRTRDILSHKPATKLLQDKWKVPEEGAELKRTQAPASNGRDNILTQLGAFRRKLHQEHIKLESRLQQQSP